MNHDPTLEQQWEELKKEMGMEDVPLQKQLKHFVSSQHDGILLNQYVKILAILELSHNFHHRFGIKNHGITDSILYWTLIATTNINMLIQGVKNEHSLLVGPKNTSIASQLDWLISCYFSYLSHQDTACWPPDSRRSRIIRDKWNSPELEDSYFTRLCRHNTDIHHANILCIMLRCALNSLVDLMKTKKEAECMLAFKENQASGTSASSSRQHA